MLTRDRIAEITGWLKDVFDSAVRDALRDWDAARLIVDPLEVLPPELGSACLRQLPLRSCIAASHVSHAWRRAALAERSLWALYRVPRSIGRTRASPEALAALLARSHPLPFHFEYGGFDFGGISRVIYDLVLEHTDRMGELELDDPAFVARLMHADAPPLPLLRRLELRSSVGGIVYELPAQWAAQKAPRLEHLDVWGFVLPAACQPFAALRTLRAVLPVGRVSAVSFSELFPRLTSLELERVTPAMLPMLTPLPAALEVANLSTDCAVREPVDYARFFRGVGVPCALRKLTVDGSKGFADALELFARARDGPWKLQVAEDCVEFRDAARADVEWTVYVFKDPPRLEAEHGGAALAHLQRLAELQLPLPAFVALHTHAGWTRALPCLRALVLDVDDLDSLGGDGVPAAGISLPELDYLELRYGWTGHGGLKAWLAGPMAALLPALLAGRGENSLSTVFLRSCDVPRLERADVAPLLLLAHRVLVGTKKAHAYGAELAFERLES